MDENSGQTTISYFYCSHAFKYTRPWLSITWPDYSGPCSVLRSVSPVHEFPPACYLVLPT